MTGFKYLSTFFLLLAVSMLLPARTQAEFVAYNDCVQDADPPNTTIYSDYLGGGGGFEVPGGYLKNFETGLYTSVWVELEASNVAYSTGTMPDAGTPAHGVFNGFVNLDASASYGNSSSDWYYQVTFSGLDPNKTYEFVTTANRNSLSYAGSGTSSRWTEFSIIGADTYTNASSGGVMQVTPDVLKMNTGYNTSTGDIIQWTGITAADGSFTVLSQNVGSGGPGELIKSYGIQGFRLTELDEALPCSDTDGDGYGVCPDCGTANGCTYDGNDCDDTDDEIYPGATEVSCDGIDQDCSGADSCEFILDDTDAVFDPDAEWLYWSGAADEYGDGFRYTYVNQGSTATWTPDLVQAGRYNVYAWWTANKYRPTNAPYTINYSGGSETVRVDQKANGGQWNLLGTYGFAAGTSGYIQLSDDANPTVVAADAVMFEFVEGAYELSGRITESGAGLDGVTVALSGDETNSTTTSGGGYYSFLLPDGSYTVTPGLAGYDFDPDSINMTVSGVDQLNQDFTAEVIITVIIDDPNATYAGSWLTWSGRPDEYQGGFHYTLQGIGADTATFTPTITSVGNYNVYAWWTAHSNRATNAPYTICYNGGSQSDTVYVNQRINGGQWVYLGNYYLTVGTDNYVVLSDNADGIVAADALKFESGSPPAPPTAPYPIVDDANSTTTFLGNWPLWSGQPDEYQGGFHYTLKGTGADTATFVTTIPSDGDYNVYAWWTAYSNRATNAPYTIYYNGGGQSETVRVNQQANGGQWVYLGNYYFTAGTDNYVVVSDNADGIVVADAVKFEPGDPPAPPTPPYPIVDDLAATTAFSGNWSIWSGQPDEYQGGFHYTLKGTGADTATFVTTIPSDGNYNVYAWWTAYSNRATNAPYTIYYNGGGQSETVRVNQQANGGQWNLLGTYYLTTGTDNYVLISDDADGVVVADAVRFEAAP
jgi:hypothetical protein